MVCCRNRKIVICVSCKIQNKMDVAVNKRVARNTTCSNVAYHFYRGDLEIAANSLCICCTSLLLNSSNDGCC